MTVTEETPRSRPARESAARTYAHALPIVPVRARGLTIEGADGRRYLDCLSGAGTLALGHNHPVVLEAIRRVLDSGAPLQVQDLSTPVEEAFVAELLRTLPPDLADHARVRFCGPSRASALEDAQRLVRAVTGRREVLTLGPEEAPRRPHAAVGLQVAEGEDRSGSARLHEGEAAPCAASAHPRAVPTSTRGTELATGWPESAHPAGVIVQSVLGDDRVTPTPDSWTRHVRQLATARAVPLIADEAETGVGRTGTFWGIEHSGITPDVMVLSKAIGGSLPLSLVVHHADLQPSAPASTARGNQLAMAAGTATLTYVRENHLAERAATLGGHVLAQLAELARQFPCISDVRGRGLMAGIEFVPLEPGVGAGSHPVPAPVTGAGLGRGPEPGFGPESAPSVRRTPAEPLRKAASELAATVQRECLRRGLIVGLTGSDLNVVRLLPPLTISDEQAAAVIDRLSDAVGAAAHTTA